LAESIAFTERCEKAISSGELQALHRTLKDVLEKYTNADYGKAADRHLLELKYKALIMDIIHYIDVVEQLVSEGCKSANDWPWQRQLRFYLDRSGVAIIRMVDAEFFYTYEYQGNAPKLVHTPLTDKCYLTLTQGMHMGFGGNPYGPAGTGKTESVKALGGLFGRQVLVFNCDEGIDVKSIGRIFVGICKCGAWGCFDEFNRLDEAVLSAVSMQIQVIQDSLRSRSGKTTLLGKDITIDNNSGIFVTLNPAGKGYGGRSKLPDNLKQLFRPVAMTKPDNDLIAEVILYSEGFKDAKNLGRKLVSLFTLSKQLLSAQQHYDWGLRALKTVLKSCGSLLHSTKRQAVQIDAAKEVELIVKAARFNTMSKLTFADSKRFDALLRDIFPNVRITEFEYEELKKALSQVFAEHKLIFNNIQLKKALEVFEQLRQRTGVVVVGPSGSGKSVLWKMLKEALIKTGKMVKTYVMNPKAISRHQLLGHIDVDTREWTDGVLTAASRQVIKEPTEVQSWIVCDGDIDPEWIESLNSVLDDNRLLTMPSGDRIQFGPNVNFLFETDDLSCASPATISRMGMIFLSDEDTDVKAIVDSWLSNEPDESREQTETLVNQYFFTAFEWIMNKNDFLVSTSLVGTILNGLSHLHGIRDKANFGIGLIRGLGGNLPEETLNEFAKSVLKMVGESSVEGDGLAFNITYDSRSDCIRPYVNEVNSCSI
jgi:dynein heavy chain 2